MTHSQEMKVPTDFASPEDWRTYVRQTVPPEDINFALAMGRTRLFFRFYEVRKQPFPEAFRCELERIDQISDPERTKALAALNDKIFVDMTRFLFEAAPKTTPSPAQDESIAPATPCFIAKTLISYLGKNNLYFAIWAVYREQEERGDEVLPWKEHVQNEIGADAGSEVEFTLLMGQMGKLLHSFRDHDLPLPPFHYERISVLHHLSGAERNLQARALVQGLVEVMPSCGSA